MTQHTREQTDIDRLAEEHLDASVVLSPLEATALGVAGHDDRLDDLSVEGLRVEFPTRHGTLAEYRAALHVVVFKSH